MPSLIRILQCRNKRIYPCTMRNCGWIWWVRNQWMQPNIDNSTSIMKLQIAVRSTAPFEYWPRAPVQYYIFIIVVAYSIHMCSWAFENVRRSRVAVPTLRWGAPHRQQLPFLFFIFSSTRALRFGSTNVQVQVSHFLVFCFCICIWTPIVRKLAV